MCFLFLYKAQQCYRRFDCFLTNSLAFYLLNLTLFQFLDNSQVTRSEVKKLIWLLTKDNLEATHHLNRLISDKILMAVRGHHTHPDLVDSVRHEMSLLRVTVAKDDSCCRRPSNVPSGSIGPTWKITHFPGRNPPFWNSSSR